MHYLLMGGGGELYFFSELPISLNIYKIGWMMPNSLWSPIPYKFVSDWKFELLLMYNNASLNIQCKSWIPRCQKYNNTCYIITHDRNLNLKKVRVVEESPAIFHIWHITSFHNKDCTWIPIDRLWISYQDDAPTN